MGDSKPFAARMAAHGLIDLVHAEGRFRDVSGEVVELGQTGPKPLRFQNL